MSGLEAPAIAALAMSAASTATSIQQASSQRKAQARQVAQQQEQAALQQRIEERRLERQKRSEQATARARLGAAGVSSTGGSGAAVIGGLENAYDRRLSENRSALNQANSGPVNLLDDGAAKTNALIGFGNQVVGTLVG